MSTIERGRRWHHNLETGELYQPVSIAYVTDDAKQGTMAARQVNLTANTVAAITLPDWATGFRLYPLTSMVRYAMEEDPQTLTTNSWTIGDIAMPDQWDGPRIVPSTETNQLRLLATVDTTVFLSIF